MMRTNEQVTAQIAIEAIVNAGGEGYSLKDMFAVGVLAVESGVSETYLNMLRPLLNDGLAA